jgi:hypothetical protein
MRAKSFVVLLALISFYSFSIPDLAYAKGGGHGGGGGRSGSHSGKSSSGKSSSGKSHGGSYKGGKYKKPPSGKHYQRRGSKSSSSYSGKSKSSKNYAAPHSYNSGVKRDKNGRIERSQSAKQDFLKQHGYSKVPKGYQVDHKVPLYAGGKDEPSNMQLLSVKQHQQKTRDDYKKYGR